MLMLGEIWSRFPGPRGRAIRRDGVEQDIDRTRPRYPPSPRGGASLGAAVPPESV